MIKFSNVEDEDNVGYPFFLFMSKVIFTDHSNAVSLFIVTGVNFIIGVGLPFLYA